MDGDLVQVVMDRKALGAFDEWLAGRGLERFPIPWSSPEGRATLAGEPSSRCPQCGAMQPDLATFGLTPLTLG